MFQTRSRLVQKCQVHSARGSVLGIELRKDWGHVKEGLAVNSNGFLRCQARGAPTPDLGEQTDLASAYVLRPLNHLVLDFEAWGRGWMNERKPRCIPDRSVLERT